MRRDAGRWEVVGTYAAAWAALEAVLGVALHGLHVPFCGVLLSALAAAICVVQRRLHAWPGVTILTALVVATTRLMLPGRAVLGPFVAVAVEGALMEAVFLLLGRGRVGALSAGALVTLWSAAQGLITQVIVYGRAVLDLYVAVSERLLGFTGLPDGWGWAILAATAGAIASVGVAGGVYGLRLARALSDAPTVPIPSIEAEGLGERVAPVRVRGVLLAALILGGAIFLAGQWRGSWLLTIPGLALWIAAAACLNSSALLRVLRPRFWVISALFALGSGVLLGEPDCNVAGVSLSRSGLETGLDLLVRALFMVSLGALAGSVISRGGSWTRHLAGSPFGSALGRALALLPRWVEHLAGGIRQRPGEGRLRQLSRLLRAAGLRELLAEVEGHLAEPADLRVVAVTGPEGSGKTTLLRDAGRRLEAAEISVAGVIQPRCDDSGGGGYDLLDLASGERHSLASALKDKSGFRFDPTGFAWAASRIDEAPGDAVLMVDELGWLEGSGRGHLPALRRRLERSPRPLALVVAVRREVVEPLRVALGLSHWRVVHAEAVTGGELASMLQGIAPSPFGGYTESNVTPASR